MTLRTPYYTIPLAMYLFPSRTAKEVESAQANNESKPAKKAKDKPEEAVRQWCLYELMRAYGLNISELEFEYPAKVGSRTYRIDILIRRNGAPWIVVECKKQSFNDHDKGLEQAISYAKSERVQAEYAVYTNGTAWLVSRHIRGEWTTVPDIPQRIDRHAGIEINWFMLGLHDAAPLLYKLDEQLEGEEASAFLEAMQRFFHGNNILTQDVDNRLRSAADYLLRTLIRDNDDYGKGKCSAFLRDMAGYCNEKKLAKIYVPSEIKSIEQELSSLRGILYEVIEGTKGLVNPDTHALRIITALVEYGKRQGPRKKQFALIRQPLHHALREFLEYSFLRYLNFELPDVADTIGVSDMKSHFHVHWEQSVQLAARR